MTIEATGRRERGEMNCGVPGQFHEFTALQLITLVIIVTEQFLSRSALHINTNKPSQF